MAFSQPLGFQTNHFLEAKVACKIVKLAFDMGIKKLWLEGDSNNIIRCIKFITQPSWSIANIIEETRSILEYFECVYVTHVYREANTMEDWFSNEAVRQDKLMTWNSGRNFLKEVKSLIELEKIQRVQWRSKCNYDI